MPEMTDELFAVAPPPTGEIENAVKETFADLDAKRAVLTKAAAALDRSLNEGAPSVATSNVLKNVLESLDSLPRPAEGTDRELDAFDAALAELTRDAFTRS